MSEKVCIRAFLGSEMIPGSILHCIFELVLSAEVVSVLYEQIRSESYIYSVEELNDLQGSIRIKLFWDLYNRIMVLAVE